MTDSQSHSTLREMRDHLTAPMALALFAAIAAVLTLMAPFETARLGVVARFGYWLAIVVPTYSAGYGINLMFRGPRFRHVRPPVRIAVAAVCTGAAVSLLVLGLHGAMTATLPPAASVPAFVANTFAIALIISIALQVILDPRDPPISDQPGPAPLLQRLAHHNRGALVALSVEDHYVRVRTTGGEEMVLIRLSDAMRETGATPGLQVHRSHWVALDQVTAARRQGDRALLTLTHGEDIPVSRRYVPAIKEAGLLP